MNYYDGVKLLGLKDINGDTPEIYMCCGNRTAGKTYYFKRWFLRRFVRYGEKFAVLVRFQYETDSLADNFFKDIAQEPEFAGGEMETRSIGKGLFQELWYNKEHCGYAIAINCADTIKKYSSRFVDCTRIFMDEFQSEAGKYAPDEITKFQSIHTSIARGGGAQYRRVPVYMAANTVSILNPYFVSLGIHKMLTSQTKFLRGEGWVLEITMNESAAKAQKEAAFNRAFANTDYAQYSQDNRYLLDNYNFIEKLDGDCRLQAVLTSGEKFYGIWHYPQYGLIHVNHKYDPTFPYVFACGINDHKALTTYGRANVNFMKHFKNNFECGNMRFADLECKNVFLDMVGML